MTANDGRILQIGFILSEIYIRFCAQSNFVSDAMCIRIRARCTLNSQSMPTNRLLDGVQTVWKRDGGRDIILRSEGRDKQSKYVC